MLLTRHYSGATTHTISEPFRIKSKDWEKVRDAMIDEVSARREGVYRITITDPLHDPDVRWDSNPYFFWAADPTNLPIQV